MVTDSLIITRLVDTTVIVAGSKQAKKEDLKKLINHIKHIGGRLAGVVVNKVPVSPKKYDQSYYYGSTTMSVGGNENTKRNSTNNYKEHEISKNNDNILEKKETKLEETQEMLRRIKEYVDNEKMNLNNSGEE